MLGAMKILHVGSPQVGNVVGIDGFETIDDRLELACAAVPSDACALTNVVYCHRQASKRIICSEVNGQKDFMVGLTANNSMRDDQVIEGRANHCEQAW